MIRESIQLNNHKYIFDLYKNGFDKHLNFVNKKFCILRSYDVVNTVTFDKEIYVIEEDLLEKYFNKEYNVIFPVVYNYKKNDNVSINQYSLNPDDFNDTFYKFNNINARDVIKLKNIIVTDNNEYIPVEVELPCDILRIYHPHTVKSINGIIHIENYINNIHFHWLIKEFKDFDNTGSVKEFMFDNNKYTEYIEFNIPNPESIINKTVYFDDFLNYVDIDTTSIEEFKFLSVTCNDKIQYTSMFALSLPFNIIDREIQIGDEKFIQPTKKYYPELQYVIRKHIVSHPLSIKYVPVKEIKEQKYVLNDDIQVNSDIFNVDTRITLTSEFGFDEEGDPALINIFDFPARDTFKCFKDAYEYLYGVNLKDYTGIVHAPVRLDSDGNEYIDEDFEDTEDEKFCFFEVNIYNNIAKTSKIYSKMLFFEDIVNDLDDFSYKLIGIFKSWDNYFGNIITEVRFVDKYLGIQFISNDVYIDSEKFKYLIDFNKRSFNSDEVTIEHIDNPYITDEKRLPLQEKVTITQSKQERTIRLINKQDEINSINEMDLNKCNFIDKINCTVNIINREDKNNVPKVYNNPRIIYKPIFFKTTPVQNIEIKRGFSQNIGINLDAFMTKVETFKITIENNEFIEQGRNDVFVIFNINAKIISNINGEYHLSNQDDEYITSGKYTVI